MTKNFRQNTFHFVHRELLADAVSRPRAERNVEEWALCVDASGSLESLRPEFVRFAEVLWVLLHVVHRDDDVRSGGNDAVLGCKCKWA